MPGEGLGGGHSCFDGAPDDYTVWQLSGSQVGGMMQMTDERFPVIG